MASIQYRDGKWLARVRKAGFRSTSKTFAIKRLAKIGLGHKSTRLRREWRGFLIRQQRLPGSSSVIKRQSQFTRKAKETKVVA